MKTTEHTQQLCPNCENHCPSDQLRCPRGIAYFSGKENPDDSRQQQDLEHMAPEDAVIMLMRKCGHYLHHHGANASNAQLLSTLSDAEKRELIALLKKCTQDWA